MHAGQCQFSHSAKGQGVQGEFLLLMARALRPHVSRGEEYKNNDGSSLFNSVVDEVNQCVFCLFGSVFLLLLEPPVGGARSGERWTSTAPLYRNSSTRRMRRLGRAWRRRCCLSSSRTPFPSTTTKNASRRFLVKKYGNIQDLVDLITSKFGFLVKPSEERMKTVEEFQKWMQEQGLLRRLRFLRFFFGVLRRQDEEGTETPEEDHWVDAWPRAEDMEESTLQQRVYYIMAHHHYRGCSYPEVREAFKNEVADGVFREALPHKFDSLASANVADPRSFSLPRTLHLP